MSSSPSLGFRVYELFGLLPSVTGPRTQGPWPTPAHSVPRKPSAPAPDCHMLRCLGVVSGSGTASPWSGSSGLRSSRRGSSAVTHPNSPSVRGGAQPPTHRRLGRPLRPPTYFATFAGGEHHQVCPSLPAVRGRAPKRLGLNFLLCETVGPNPKYYSYSYSHRI